MGFSRNIRAFSSGLLPPSGQPSNWPRRANKDSEQKIPGVGSGKRAKQKIDLRRRKRKTVLLEKLVTREGCRKHLFPPGVDAFTCRLMKLEVVSEDVLPSERLKRLLRLGNFLGSCEHQEDTWFSCTHWYFCFPSPAFSQYSSPSKMNVAACVLTGPVNELGHKYPGTSAQAS